MTDRPVIPFSRVPLIRRAVKARAAQYRLVAFEERLKSSPDFGLIERSLSAHDALRAVLLDIDTINSERTTAAGEPVCADTAKDQ